MANQQERVITTTRTFTSNDEGKRIVTTDGDVIGSVVRIEAGDAHVRPKPELWEGCGSWIMGYRCGAFRLNEEHVESITDERIIIATTESDSAETNPGVKK
jgi:hypothetical protein